MSNLMTNALKNKEIRDAIQTELFKVEDGIFKIKQVIAVELEKEMEEYWGCIPDGWGDECEELYNHAIQRCIDIVKKVLS